MGSRSFRRASRAEGAHSTPALILSALGQVDDRVKGLRAGGDDYLAKPYAFAELLALRRSAARPPAAEGSSGEETIYRVGGLELDRLAHKASRAMAEEIILAAARVSSARISHAATRDKVVTRTMLLENVWDYHFDPQTNVIDVHISRLRAKIDKRSSTTPLLHTVRGAGYMIRDGAR